MKRHIIKTKGALNLKGTQLVIDLDPNDVYDKLHKLHEVFGFNIDVTIVIDVENENALRLFSYPCHFVIRNQKEKKK